MFRFGVRYDASEILDRMDDVALFEGSALEYEEEYTGMLDDIPKNLATTLILFAVKELIICCSDPLNPSLL